MSYGDLPGRRTTVKHWPVSGGGVHFSGCLGKNILCSEGIYSWYRLLRRGRCTSNSHVGSRRVPAEEQKYDKDDVTGLDDDRNNNNILYYAIIYLLCSLFAVTLRVLRCSGLINIIWIAHDVVVLHRNCIRKRSRSTELLCFATEELWISLLTIHVCHYMMYQGCVQKIISLADFFLDLRDGYGVHPCEVISLWSEYIVRYF